MFFSENNRLSKPHFDWPLLVTSYSFCAVRGVGDHHCKLQPVPRLRPLFCRI